jgi:chromosome segregation ATPase
MAAQNRLPRCLLSVSLGLVLAVASSLADAADNTFKQSAELGKRTAQASEHVDKYVAQLDKTKQALSSVSQAQGKDLKKRYQSFSKQVNNLEEAQKAATSDINEMKSKGAEYFLSWDTSNARITNPELKQSSIERRTTVMKDYDELAADLSEVGRELEPFMGNLHDLRSFLGADLSPAHVRNANGVIQKSQAEALSLKQKIAPVQTTLKQFVSEAPK